MFCIYVALRAASARSCLPFLTICKSECTSVCARWCSDTVCLLSPPRTHLLGLNLPLSLSKCSDIWLLTQDLYSLPEAIISALIVNNDANANREDPALN